MFTGIIQGLGRVRSLKLGVLLLTPPLDFAPKGYDIGESIAVNGCCLTVVEEAEYLKFELSPETLSRTSLGELTEGAIVNLERAMTAEARFGGHMVQGHVDATGTIDAITPSGNSIVYRFQIPREYDRYVIDKGSIAIDGISLTAVGPNQGILDVWVIPHTLQETNLATRKVGDHVNLEFDMIARYVEKLMAAHTAIE